MKHEDPITKISSQAGVAVNEIQENPIGCISCNKPLGFAAIQTIAPPRGSFAFRTRFACEECGQTAATLALQATQGEC